jgi:hypothetical protein
VDKDKWTDQQLIELFEWSQGRENYGFALSNPKFRLPDVGRVFAGNFGNGDGTFFCKNGKDMAV